MNPLNFVFGKQFANVPCFWVKYVCISLTTQCFKPFFRSRNIGESCIYNMYHMFKVNIGPRDCTHSLTKLGKAKIKFYSFKLYGHIKKQNTYHTTLLNRFHQRDKVLQIGTICSIFRIMKLVEEFAAILGFAMARNFLFFGRKTVVERYFFAFFDKILGINEYSFDTILKNNTRDAVRLA